MIEEDGIFNLQAEVLALLEMKLQVFLLIMA